MITATSNDYPADATVAGIGEFALVEQISAIVAASPRPAGLALGIGDDAALIAASDGRVVATMDLLVDTVHFRTDWSSALDIGHKAAAQNLADLAAMGASPTALLLGLALPGTTSVSWLRDVVTGMVAEAAELGAALIGGDVTRSDRVVLAITALGDLQGREPVRRSGARPGDVVAIIGRLGWASAGLTVLTRGFRSPRALVDAHRRPHPPYASGPVAALAGATAMIDVSDGLVGDLGHVARASNVVLSLHSELLPVDAPLLDAAAAFNLPAVDWVLTGGDDHALAITFPADAALPDNAIVIGTVLAPDERGPGVWVDGSPYAGLGGHRHFVE